MQAKVAVKHKRRRHSEEFKAQVAVACRQPGVSVAAVALAHGLNANLVRRWIKENTQSLPVPRQPMTTPVAEPLMVVPVTLASPQDTSDDAIRIDIRRTGLAVQLAWPAMRAVELSGLLKDLLT